MKRIAIIALLLTAVPADAQLLRRVFGGGSCGPAGCSVQPAYRPVEYVVQPDPEPIEAPKPVGDRTKDFPTGVVRELLNQKDHCTYTMNGQHVSAKAAFDAILDDDSEKLWLVLVGDQREKQAKEFEEKLPQLAARTRVILYAKDHVRAASYPNAVTLLHPKGEEIYKSDTFDVESLRRADPNYVPDPAKQNWIPALVLGGFVAVLLLLRRL